MNSDPSSWVVGPMMTVFGFVGLFLAAGARDNEMYVFGLSLVVFAVLFVMGLVKRHFDLAAIAAKARKAGHV